MKPAPTAWSAPMIIVVTNTRPSLCPLGICPGPRVSRPSCGDFTTTPCPHGFAPGTKVAHSLPVVVAGTGGVRARPVWPPRPLSPASGHSAQDRSRGSPSNMAYKVTGHTVGAGPACATSNQTHKGSKVWSDQLRVGGSPGHDPGATRRLDSVPASHNGTARQRPHRPPGKPGKTASASTTQCAERVVPNTGCDPGATSRVAPCHLSTTSARSAWSQPALRESW